jgi:hypothetical protein
MATSAPKIELPTHSAYIDTPVYQIGGDIFFGLLRDPITPDLTDGSFTVTQGFENRLDLISNNFYGTQDLWWVIAMVNDIMDPLLGVQVNTILRIPTKTRLANAGVLS